MTTSRTLPALPAAGQPAVVTTWPNHRTGGGSQSSAARIELIYARRPDSAYPPAVRVGEEGNVPGDAEPPDYEHILAAALPSNPNDLLTDEQKSGLSADLAKLARLRREAEIASATLRLA